LSGGGEVAEWKEPGPVPRIIRGDRGGNSLLLAAVPIRKVSMVEYKNNRMSTENHQAMDIQR